MKKTTTLSLLFTFLALFLSSLPLEAAADFLQLHHLLKRLKYRKSLFILSENE